MKRKWRIGWWTILLALTLIWIMNLGVIITTDLADGNRPQWLRMFIHETSGAYLLMPLVYVLGWFFARFPLNQNNYKRRFPLYLLATVIFGLSHTILMFLVRTPLYWLLNMGSYLDQYGLLQYRVPMEYLKQTLFFWIFFGAYQLLQQWQERHQQQLRTAALEQQLSKARLMALQMQLNPHFLFNTLNLVSSTMYEQPEVADRILASLSEMLRIALSLKDRQEHSLDDELELLDRYIRIMKTRFQDRLEVDQEIATTTRPALVPVFLLQPLVENAIKYSVENMGDAQVRLQTVQDGNRLRIVCEDSGPGLSPHLPARNGNGIGLNNTIQRLEERYGDQYRFEIVEKDSRGTCVTLEIPYAV